jgi:hypothetical protein
VTTGAGAKKACREMIEGKGRRTRGFHFHKKNSNTPKHTQEITKTQTRMNKKGRPQEEVRSRFTQMHKQAFS